MHAPLLVVTTASCAAPLLHATVSTTTASASSRVSAIAPSSTAVVSSSRVRTRSPSPNQPDLESWIPTSPIRPLVWSPATAASSLDTSPQLQRGSTHSSASRAFAGPVPQPSPSASSFAHPATEINPKEHAVAIVIDATRYRAYSYGGLYFKLVRRIVVFDQKSILADWRVKCEAPTLITQDDPQNALDLNIERRLPLKTYTEALHELSQILDRKYIAFHDRDSVLDALRLSLPLDRTTDIGQNIYIRNYALRVNGNCWCRSRRTLVDLEML